MKLLLAGICVLLSCGFTRGCECVPYHQCLNGTFNIYGFNVIEGRMGVCNNQLWMCCEDPDSDSEEETPATSPPLPLLKECGHRNENGVGIKVIDPQDGESNYGEFPWMVAVLRKDDLGIDEYLGGSSLIHPKAVITAAHIIAGNPNDLKIRAGEWDTRNTAEKYPYQERDVNNVIIHDDFQNRNHLNNIALLILANPVELSIHINVVCLPPANFVVNSGTRCFATGWGRKVFAKEDRLHAMLKKIDLPIVDRSTCQKWFRKTRLGDRFVVHDSFVCAGGEFGKDTCKGDGGSPLVCPIPNKNGRYFQTGVVSWGIGCGDKEVPGAYVNIAFFRKWIDEKMTSNGLDQPYNY